MTSRADCINVFERPITAAAVLTASPRSTFFASSDLTRSIAKALVTTRSPMQLIKLSRRDIVESEGCERDRQFGRDPKYDLRLNPKRPAVTQKKTGYVRPCIAIKVCWRAGPYNRAVR